MQILVGALFRAIGTPDLPMSALSHAKLTHAVYVHLALPSSSSSSSSQIILLHHRERSFFENIGAHQPGGTYTYAHIHMCTCVCVCLYILFSLRISFTHPHHHCLPPPSAIPSFLPFCPPQPSDFCRSPVFRCRRDYADWNEYLSANLRWPTVFPIRSVSDRWHTCQVPTTQT